MPDATLQPPTPSENASFSPLFCSDDKLRRRRPSSRTHLTSAVSPRHLHPAKPQPRFSPTTHLFPHTCALRGSAGLCGPPCGPLATHDTPQAGPQTLLGVNRPFPRLGTGFSPLSLPVSRSPLPLILPPPQSLAVDLLPNSRTNYGRQGGSASPPDPPTPLPLCRCCPGLRVPSPWGTSVLPGPTTPAAHWNLSVWPFPAMTPSLSCSSISHALRRASSSRTF